MPQTRGRPPKYANPKEFDDRVKHYFDSITITYQVFDSKKVGHDNEGKPIYEQIPRLNNAGELIFRTEYEENPSVLGLCRHLGIHRDTLCEYDKLDKFSDTIKKSKARIEEYLENQLYRHEQVTGIIFNLKNNFGWKDKTETDMNVQGDIRNTHYGRMGIVNEIKLDDKTIELYKELHRREKEAGMD